MPQKQFFSRDNVGNKAEYPPPLQKKKKTASVHWRVFNSSFCGLVHKGTLHIMLPKLS
jgi:hypothetical protein